MMQYVAKKHRLLYFILGNVLHEAFNKFFFFFSFIVGVVSYIRILLSI